MHERAPVPRRYRLAGLLATALLLGLYARGGHAWLLGFVALVPWLLALDAERSLRGALISALLMSLAFVVAALHWFGAAIGAYTGIGTVTGMLALFVLAPLLQPQFIAFALIRHWVGQRHGVALRALAGASAWVGCEWLLPKLLGDSLGHGLFPSTTLRQVADLGGVAGLSFLLILCSEALVVAVRRCRHGLRTALPSLGMMAVLVAAMAGYGLARLQALQANPAEPKQSLRVGVVQANITGYEQLREEMGTYAVVRHVLDTHYALSQAAIEHHDADALLWSETVYPTTFGNPRSADGAALDREIEAFVTAMGVPLVFGTYDIDAEGEYNAAAFVEPGSGLLGHYRKTHPFPLTEYVPAWLDGPWLRGWLPWAGHWKPGSGARVFPLRTADGREVNVLPLICLDDVRSALAIDGARLGAQAILGLSNDSWFADYPIGARLHLAVAAFRSVETRLPQVRVTTNGMSAVIDERGEVLVSTAMDSQAVLAAGIPARNPPLTLMVRWGDWVGRAGLVFLLLLGASTGWRKLARRLAAADLAAAGTLSDANFSAPIIALSPVWRALTAGLRLCAGAGLLWLALGMLLRDGLQVNSLAQIWLFAAAVVAPSLAAWAIQRAFSGHARIENGRLVLELRNRRVEIPRNQITYLRTWRLSLPGPGLDIRLAAGQAWQQGIVLRDQAALLHALRESGHAAAIASDQNPRIATLSQVRAASPRRWYDHGALKFALFPLLPALPAFRLHQVIAFGGSFGEYHTYGLTAWLTGLGIWWVAWSIGLMLFAALLRIGIEASTLLALGLGPAHATDARRQLEWLGRLAFYFGVPCWLLLRILAA